MLPGSDYVMRATVKVRSLATLCSFTSRLITVSSVANPNARDAVRFTAALAPGCPNLTLSPGELSSVNDYLFSFGPAEDRDTQTFTVKNDGTGASDELGFFLGGQDFVIGISSTCRGILPAGGTCTFEFVVTGCSFDSGLNGYFSLAGDTIQYLTLHLTALCSLSG